VEFWEGVDAPLTDSIEKQFGYVLLKIPGGHIELACGNIGFIVGNFTVARVGGSLRERGQTR